MSDCIRDCMITEAINRMRSNDSSSKICWYCSKVNNEDLLACKKCSIARYCDKTCQKNDWKSIHKVVCVIHRDDIDDATNFNLGLTPSMDLFTKATDHYIAKHYLKAERLYKNLLLLLRNTIRDHAKLVKRLQKDNLLIETLHSNVIIDDMNDVSSYTGALHNLASTYYGLKKFDDAELFFIKSIDAQHQLSGGNDSNPNAIPSMKMLVKLYRESPLNKQSEIDTLNKRIAAIEALNDKK